MSKFDGLRCFISFINVGNDIYKQLLRFFRLLKEFEDNDGRNVDNDRAVFL
jgi:hypothetical protein